MVDYREPTSVDEASALLSEHGDVAKVIAGGTAVVLMMQQSLIAPDLLVSLRRLEGLRGIGRQGAAVRIGASTRLAEIASSPLVRGLLPSLAYACGRVGNARIRNMATLGGNLAEADYASDPPSVLASLGATCTVERRGGSRSLPITQLITDHYTNALEDGDLITAVRIPAPDGDRRAVYLKYISRSSEDRACVGVAVRGDFDGDVVADLDIVVGAVASTPQRVPAASAALVGRRLEPDAMHEVAERYAAQIEPMDDLRGSRWYRGRMISVFVRRALEAIAAGNGSTTRGQSS